MPPRPPISTLFPYTTLFRSTDGRMVPARFRLECARHTRVERTGQPQHTDGAAVAHPSPSRSFLSRSEEHTSELQSHVNLVCRLLLEKKNTVESRARQRRDRV